MHMNSNCMLHNQPLHYPKWPSISFPFKHCYINVILSDFVIHSCFITEVIHEPEVSLNIVLMFSFNHSGRIHNVSDLEDECSTQ